MEVQKIKDDVNALAQGWMDQTRITTAPPEQLRPGWNEVIAGEQQKKAQDHVKAIFIQRENADGTVGGFNPGAELELRDLLDALARVTPGFAMGLHNIIHILDGGGNDDEPHGVTRLPDHTVITNGKSAYEDFWAALLHESMHRVLYDITAVKEVTSLSKMTNYLKTYLDSNYHLVKTYAEADWQKAAYLKDNGLLLIHLPGEIIAEVNGKPPSQEQQILRVRTLSQKLYTKLKNYGMEFQASDLAEWGEAKSDHPAYPLYVWNKVAHAVLSYHWQLKKATNLTAKQLAAREAFMVDQEMQDVVKTIVEEFAHYLVGPLQQEKGGMSDMNTRMPGFLENPVTQANIATQRALLEAFTVERPDSRVNIFQFVEGALVEYNRQYYDHSKK